MLASLMVEAAEADAVRQVIGPLPRAVDEVMVFEIAPRRAARGRATPAIPNVDGVALPARRRAAGSTCDL